MREIGDLGLYNQHAKTTPNRHYGSSYEQMGPSLCTLLMWTGRYPWVTKHNKKKTKIQPFKFQSWALHWFRARWMKSDKRIRNRGRAILFSLHWILKRSMALLYSKNSNFLWVEKLVFINGFIVHFTEFSYKVTSTFLVFVLLDHWLKTHYHPFLLLLFNLVRMFFIFFGVVLKDKRREQMQLVRFFTIFFKMTKWNIRIWMGKLIPFTPRRMQSMQQPKFFLE